MLRILFLLLLANAAFAQERLFPIEIKGKWGYMDNAGKMRIPAKYDLADDYYEGYAVVALNNQPCVITAADKRVIDTGFYQTIDHCSEGLFSVTDHKNHKFYIDSKGVKVLSLPDHIYQAGIFSKGLAMVSKQVDLHETRFGRDIVTLGFKFGYIDTKGNLLVDFIYDDAENFQPNGLARIRSGSKFGLMNTSCKETVKPAYSMIGAFSEGKAVISENDLFGVIAEDGRVLVKPRFELLLDFSEGMAGYFEKGLFGYTDEAGNVLIKAQYGAVRPFVEGKAAVQIEGKWGFINKSGTVVIRNVFDNATVFSEGLCAVNIKRNWGFIDKDGRMVIPAEYEAVGSFSNGVADVVYRNLSLYISSRGEVLPRLKD